MNFRSNMRRLGRALADYEGFYVIAEHSEAVLTVRGAARGILRDRSDRLRVFLRGLLREVDFNLDFPTLAERLSKVSAARPFEDSELFLLNEMITVELINALAADKITDRGRAERCVKTLRMTEQYDFERLYKDCSSVYKVMAAAPPEFYTACDDGSKRAALDEIYAYARRHYMSEAEAAEIYVGRERKGRRGIDFSLPILYVAALIGLTAVLAALALKKTNPLVALMLILPLFAFAKQVAEWFFSHIMPRLGLRPHSVPKLKLDAVPDEFRTLVVITTLLTGNDDAHFERLRDMFNQNRDANVTFGILADLRESDAPSAPADEKIISEALRKIDGLNKKYGKYGGKNEDCASGAKFALFVRGRTYAPSEGRYMGWERKRGALIELSRYLRGKETSFLPDSTPLSGKPYKYVITLDADTNLYIGAVRELVGAMAHPYNRPVVAGGTVVRGYGVMQPRMSTELRSAAASRFSVLTTGAGGIDNYNGACFDLYQTVFGKGAFCGKGIFDVDVYLAVLDGAFPDGRILSHDLLEGGRLRAAYLSDITLTDACPKNPLSYYSRAHRWIRGDVQSALFTGQTTTNARGERVRNPIGQTSRFMLLENVRAALTPVLATGAMNVSLLFGGRVPDYALMFALLYLVFPVAAALFSGARLLFRAFRSRVLTDVWQASLSALYNISALPYLSFISFDAVFRALWRTLVSHKKTLEWTTASDSEKKLGKGFFAYLYKMWFVAASGAATLLLAPHGAYRIVGILWLFCPLTSYLLSREYKRAGAAVSERKVAVLTDYCRDMWGFFADNVTSADHFLPPDNIQYSPVEAVAHRTSPTNIAMYLLSTLAAADFGFIGKEELLARLSDTLRTADALPKFRGHLYNWYDTEHLTVIGAPYISTVDSGNFTAALVTLRGGLDEYFGDSEAHNEAQTDALNSLYAIIDKLITLCEYGLLYNPTRNLLSMGYDTVRGELSQNCYDLFASECRTTSYLAVATGVAPKSHWHKLGRSLIGRGGFIGPLSWSGTMFEYFMPALILPTYENSFAFEGLQFALSEQIRATGRGTAGHGVWGRSESGYFAFDGDYNYQYRAFGAPSLAMDISGARESVISPYSSFLSLCAATDAPLLNLERLKRAGMYGRYGFYEAYDVTESRVGRGAAVINSYMAHHTGMAVIACANACYDNVFCKRFMRDPTMSAARELLMEQIPTGARVCKKKARRPIKPQRFGKRTGRIILPEELYKSNENPTDFVVSGEVADRRTRAAVVELSGDKLRIVASESGEVALFADDTAVSYPFFEKKNWLRTLSVRVYFETPSGKLVLDALKNAALRCTADAVVYTKTERGITLITRFSLSEKQAIMSVRVEAQGEFSSIRPTLCFEPVLVRKSSFAAHPTYGALSVEATYDADEGLLIYRRKGRVSPHKSVHREIYLGVGMSGHKIDYHTRRDALPLMYHLSDIDNLALSESENLVGRRVAPIAPYCLIGRTSAAEKIQKHSRYCCEMQIITANTRDNLITMWREVSRERGKNYADHGADLSLGVAERTRRRLFDAELTKERTAYVTLLASAVNYRNYAAPHDFFMEQSELWAHSVSGDLPIVSLALSGDSLGANELTLLRGFVAAFKFLHSGGEGLDLVILLDEREHYNAPLRGAVSSLLDTMRAPRNGKNGGVRIVPCGKNDGIYRSISGAAALHAEITPDTVFENVYYKFMSEQKTQKTAVTSVQNPVKDRVSGIVKNGYEIIKGSQKNPWSMIYANNIFGTLLTQNSLGYTYHRNSGECRLTEWSADALLDNDGERLLLTVKSHGTPDKVYDLAAVSNRVIFTFGHAEYHGKIAVGGDFVEFVVKVGAHDALPVKVVTVELSTAEDGAELDNLTLDYEVTSWLGGARREVYHKTESGDTTFYKTCTSRNGHRLGMFLTKIPDPKVVDPKVVDPTVVDPTTSVRSKRAVFLLGGIDFAHDRTYYYIREIVSGFADAEEVFAAYQERSALLTAAFKLECANQNLAEYFNGWAVYQAAYIRLFARSGFYQSSGAFGLRDQLQDALCLCPVDSSLLKLQILRNAAHQFIEGDAQHWWHQTTPNESENRHRDKPLGDVGIRSNCSDDYLWLPFAVGEYIERTGDASILDISPPYLESVPLDTAFAQLAEGENERYERPKISKYRENLYMHCVRAVELALSRISGRGLPYMGMCDWNDGFSNVGKGGGESVWLAQFLRLVLKKFIPIAASRGDADGTAKYRAADADLSRAVESYCFEDGYYLRAFYGNGSPLGKSRSSACAIDALPQAFSAIVDGKTERSASALSHMYDKLWDGEAGIFRLFAPSFDNVSTSGDVLTPDPGYVALYTAGVRENGGQYTHAALFAVWGLFEAGECRRAYEILSRINPFSRGAEYKTEPYFLCGDVYYNDAHKGRGGWSGYTGAAGWYFRVTLENLLGYKEKDGVGFTLSPSLSKDFDKFTLTVNKNGAVYRIRASVGAENSLTLDGRAAEFGSVLPFDGGAHEVEITVRIP